MNTLPQMGKSMTEWSTALQTAGYAELAAGIDSNKVASLRKLEALGVPNYRRIIAPVKDFLDDPTTHFNLLDREKYFAILAPRDDTLIRHRKKIEKEAVTTYILETVSEADRPHYDLILEEFFKHKYGGNIICNPDGTIIVEMIEGEIGHNKLVSGKTPEFTANRDPYTGVFSYSFESPLLRQAVWNTISAIPHTIDQDHSVDYQAREMQFLPGYYEFYLDERTEGSSLEPFFIDYSDLPAFTTT